MDDGSLCANAGLETYEAAGDKIWAQAGIDLVFLPFITLNSTTLWNFDTAIDSWGPFLALDIIQMFFVPDIDDTPGLFGAAWEGENGVVIADEVFSTVRLDTIAHELGHNLGLPHFDEAMGTPGCDAGEDKYLMSAGSCRDESHDIADIFPNGDLLDQLSPDEIAVAIAVGTDRGWLTDVSIPEPSTVVFSFTGLALIALRMRRQRR